MVTQVHHFFYLPLFDILFGIPNANNMICIGSLLLQYCLATYVFDVLGFSSDNSELVSREVKLLPPKPPKYRGYYRARRRHRHYYRRKKSLSSSPCLPMIANSSISVNFQSPSSDETLLLQLDLLSRNQHKILHLSWATIDLAYNVNFNEFLSSINPLKHLHLMNELDTLFPQRHSPLSCIGSVLPTIPTRNPMSMFASFLQTTSSDSPSIPLDGYGLMGSINEELPIVIDTGASTSLTPVLSDFITPLEPTHLEEIRGLTSTTRVVGRGTVEWTIKDYWNVVRVVRTTAYYVPDASIRLFSPQSYFRENNNVGRCVIQGHKTVLELPDQSVLEFPYNPGNNLPLMLPDLPAPVGLARSEVEFIADNCLLSVTDQTNQNLRPAQKELLLLHFKLGHAGFDWCQRLCQQPNDPLRHQIIIPKLPQTSSCSAPLCTACQLSKQTRRHAHEHPRRNDTSTTLRRDHLSPGDCISIDQYISALPGRLPHTKGKEKDNEKYNGGTIFVDHASSFIFLRNQVSLTAGETLRGKKAFEDYADSVGVRLHQFHADNVPFNSKEFRRNLEINGQPIAFSGTGAHHQNGVAERAIQTITRWARAMLLHSILMWPDQADLTLWPFALQHAVYLWNHIPNSSSHLAPIEIFSGSRFPNYQHLHRLHVWGCPVYVLDPKLQDGHKIPKWQPRSRRGKFLGVSPSHSTSIGLILNLQTGFVSPQYHVVYDDEFTTVPNSESGGLFRGDQPFDADHWERLVASGTERVLFDDDDDVPPPPLHADWHNPALPFATPPPPTTPPPVTASEGGNRGNRQHWEPVPSPRRLPLSPEGATPQPVVDHDYIDHDPIEPIELALDDDVEAPLPPPAPDPVPDDVPRTRSGRHVRKPNRLIETMLCHSSSVTSTPANAYRNPKRTIRASSFNLMFLMALNWSQTVESLRSADYCAMMNITERNTDVDTNTVEWMHPLSLVAKANAEDNPTWEQVMNGPDRDGYLDAARTELKTLYEDKDAWDVIDREPWMKVLKSTWAFCCKRYPDGRIRKFKARFCARGDQQIEGIDFFDTFAPVVNWNTVRLLLILSVILGLATKQVDYTAAFVHAPIDKDPNWDSMTEEERERSGVFLQMPRGFSQPGKVLKLKRSLYGLRQSPRNFFQHLKSKLESIGFRANDDIDPCLFISDKVICLVYVNDTLFFSPREEFIDEVIAKLSASDLDLEVEDSVAGFLGVHLDRNTEDGSIKLKKSGLTKRIVEALNVGGLPRKFSPAVKEPLVKDDDGDPANGAYNYASVIGMLQYLQGHSRPDITFAVSQCARFVHSPRRSHEIALERIGQYLKFTQDEGLVLRPSGSLDIDVYCDADFAGLWPYEDKLDPACVKSRTRFVICLSNCPITWTSKLQREIALSTMEAEYNALSMAMRSVLPFQNLVRSVIQGVGMDHDVLTSFKTTVYEDNAGALQLATMEPGRITPRSKHYAIKYHWFRSHLKPNHVEIQKIDSSNQKADILTKGLTKDKFESIRKLLCGW